MPYSLGYGAANSLNITGWISLAVAGVITVGTVIYVGGKAYEVYEMSGSSNARAGVKAKATATVKAKRSAKRTIYQVRTKGNENLRDSGLVDLSDEEILSRYKNPKSKKEKNRMKKELKASNKKK